MKLLQLHLTLILGASSALLFAEAQECTVTINDGQIIGAVQDTSNPLKKVCSYLGIPFASPPMGSLRFQPPQPAQTWDSPLNATALPNWCPQGETPPSGVSMSEDCLYLNVYYPVMKDSSAKNLPVMIWFHGGGFTSGSSQPYTPEKLLARGDIILVVPHYRLGMLGFLSTGTAASPGNYGLKDQSFSIRWVSQNIKAFGGNPKNVTIFGESAGSASVIYQLISPLNKGLINGVIAQSGTALATWAVDRQPLESAKIMARRLGCPTILTSWMMACLRNADWKRMIETQKMYTIENFIKMTYPVATVTPVVEPNLPGAFITKEPEAIMRNGDIDTTIPVMLGANKHDGSFVLAILHLARFGPFKLDENPEYMRNFLVPDILKFFKIQEDTANRAAASSVELAYLSGVNRSSWEASMPGLVDIFTVFAFKSSTLHTADLLSQRGSKVYLYSFEYHSKNSLWSGTTKVKSGIGHADELMYLFNYPVRFSSEDQTFSDMFCDMWLNFGNSGNPTPSPSAKYEQWPPYTAQDELYMKLNATPTVLADYRLSWRPNGFQWN